MVGFCNFLKQFVLTRLEGQLCEWLSGGVLESPGAARQRSAPGRRGVILTRLGILLTLYREPLKPLRRNSFSGFEAYSINT